MIEQRNATAQSQSAFSASRTVRRACHGRIGLSAPLTLIAKCSRHHIVCGSGATKLYLEKSIVRCGASFEKSAQALEAYFLMGGTHFQLNYISNEEL